MRVKIPSNNVRVEMTNKLLDFYPSGIPGNTSELIMNVLRGNQKTTKTFEPFVQACLFVSVSRGNARAVSSNVQFVFSSSSHTWLSSADGYPSGLMV